MRGAPGSVVRFTGGRFCEPCAAIAAQDFLARPASGGCPGQVPLTRRPAQQNVLRGEAKALTGAEPVHSLLARCPAPGRGAGTRVKTDQRRPVTSIPTL